MIAGEQKQAIFFSYRGFLIIFCFGLVADKLIHDSGTNKGKITTVMNITR